MRRLMTALLVIGAGLVTLFSGGMFVGAIGSGTQASRAIVALAPIPICLVWPCVYVLSLLMERLAGHGSDEWTSKMQSSLQDRARGA